VGAAIGAAAAAPPLCRYSRLRRLNQPMAKRRRGRLRCRCRWLPQRDPVRPRQRGSSRSLPGAMKTKAPSTAI